MRLSDLLGARVQTEAGRKLGHVQDVRVERAAGEGGEWRVKGIVIGRRGLMERIGLTAAARTDPAPSGDIVAWGDLLRLEEGTVIVGEDVEPR